MRPGALRWQWVALHLTGLRVELTEMIACQLNPVDAASVFENPVRRDVDVVGIVDPVLGRTAREVGVARVDAENGV